MAKNLFAVDKIIDNIAILENITTKEKKEININSLTNIKEGSILELNNNTYKLNPHETTKKRQEILSRFNKLKKKD